MRQPDQLIRRCWSLALLLLGACAAGPAATPDDGTGVVFITQNVVPNAVMDALFQGRVIADVDGCLRLDSPDSATVVWPKGFSLAKHGEELRVLDARGGRVSAVGQRFRLGGGEVESLAGGFGFTDAERQRLESRCPGRYWIVGDVLYQ